MTPPSEKKPTGLAAKLAAKTATLGQSLDDAQKDPSRVRIQDKPPITMPGQLGAFRLEAQRWMEKITALEKQLREAKEQGGALDLDLDLLVEVPGRRRRLAASAYAELRENLRQHALITPITVKPLGDGRYEIVSGHNRVAIYRELGRKSIKAWPADTDNDKTDELAFYANLMHTDLPAYERYQGLILIQQNNPHLNTHEALATRTGMSKAAVTELMAFAGLPAKVHQALATKPDLLTAKTAVKLAQAAKQGREAQVVEAVEAAQGASAPMEQQSIVRLVEAKPASAAPTERPQPTEYKVGRKNYCKVVRVNNTVRLDFANEADSAQAAAEIGKLIEAMAEAKRLKDG